jgi:hypothetical protein
MAVFLLGAVWFAPLAYTFCFFALSIIYVNIGIKLAINYGSQPEEE